MHFIYLVKFVVWSLILGGEVEEKLLNVPVEQRVEISLRIKFVNK